MATTFRIAKSVASGSLGIELREDAELIDELMQVLRRRAAMAA
jgi:hypothetical protein